MSTMRDERQERPRPWLPAPPGRLIGRGHPAGDFLEAHEWRVLDQEPGRFRLEAHLLDRVKNNRGHLFGGFTPTYIDLVAVQTVHSVIVEEPYRGSATVNMRVDYFDPVMDARFILESRVVHKRGRNHLVEVLFKDLQGKLLVYSITTLRQRV
jgi:acyl-coenzyme A thioesterase PaaI-like protein